MQGRGSRLIYIVLVVLLIQLSLIPVTGAQIVPKQELELSESLSLRWHSEVSCSDDGASFFRSTLDFDSDGSVTEEEIQMFLLGMQSDTDGYWVQIDGVNGTITNAYSLDYSKAVGSVYEGEDFTYSFDLELSWPDLPDSKEEYTITFINPVFVTKTETDMNIPEDWEIINYKNFDEAEVENGDADFTGVIQGAGASGDITISIPTDKESSEQDDFMLLVSFITLVVVVVVVIVILLTVTKTSE